MNSGKSTILFGDGQYLINAKIKIPKTVKRINFLFCSFACGIRLVGGEYDAAFEISEDSSDILTIENLLTWEQFRGHIRCFKHAAKRDVIFRNIQLMTASMYFNSVPGSNVYFDNCFLTTGTYTKNAWIPGHGFVPVYSHIIPYEFHGQNVYGRQVNAERADMHMLNDASNIEMDCFRIEGFGTALTSINGGKTKINLFNAGIGDKYGENAVFEISNSSFELTGCRTFGWCKEQEHNIIIRNKKDDCEETVKWDDIEGDEESHSRLLNYYKI